MNKTKIIYFCLFLFLFILIGLTLLKIKHKEEYRQKVVLAQDTHKGLVHLMYDLSKAKKHSIRGVPADGQWHDRIAFYQSRQGPLEYLVDKGRLLRISNGKALLIADNIADLRIRRQEQSPDILEVQITAQKNVSLLSNFRIRLSH
jgi:hypothetical protein